MDAPPPVETVSIVKVHGAARETAEDAIAVEEPLEIRLGVMAGGRRLYHSISVTMRTPGADHELAAGFLYTEGIVADHSLIASIEHWGPMSDGRHRNIIKADLREGVTVDLRRLERHFYTSSSCGVCGKASIDAVRVASRRAAALGSLRIAADTIRALPGLLRPVQAAFASTGGLHAAGLFDQRGALQAVREDVGRHNAMDKLIGSQIAGAHMLEDKLVLVSGRASFELVQKAAVAGIPVLAAVGAPSSLAVELAEEFGMTLVGFVRDSRFNIYCGEDRIV
jgi:FdhD protein